ALSLTFFTPSSSGLQAKNVPFSGTRKTTTFFRPLSLPTTQTCWSLSGPAFSARQWALSSCFSIFAFRSLFTWSMSAPLPSVSLHRGQSGGRGRGFSCPFAPPFPPMRPFLPFFSPPPSFLSFFSSWAAFLSPPPFLPFFPPPPLGGVVGLPPPLHPVSVTSEI